MTPFYNPVWPDLRVAARHAAIAVVPVFALAIAVLAVTP